MAQPSISTRMNEVLTLSKKVSSSVMGPDFSTLCDTELDDLTGQEDFIRDIQSIDSAEDMRNFLKERFTDPLAQQVKTKTKDNLKEFKNKSAELKDAVYNSVQEGSTGIGPDLARRNFEATIQFVRTKTRAIMRAERIINGLKLAINALEDEDTIDDDTTDEDKEEPEDSQATVLGTTTLKQWEEYTKRKSQAQLQIQEYKNELFEYFDKSLGGLKGKHDKKDLTLPRNLDKATAEEISNAFKNFLVHRAADYWAIMAWTTLTLDGHDTATGMWSHHLTMKTSRYTSEFGRHTSSTQKCSIEKYFDALAMQRCQSFYQVFHVDCTTTR